MKIIPPALVGWLDKVRYSMNDNESMQMKNSVDIEVDI